MALHLKSTGVDFTDFGDAGGMSSELLDDYERGTWTVTFGGFSGSQGNTIGYYTKIAQRVYFDYYSGTINCTGSTGAATFSVPFTQANYTEAYPLFIYIHGSAVDGNSVGGYVAKNSATAYFIDAGSTASSTYVVASNKYLMVSGSFFVA